MSGNLEFHPADIAKFGQSARTAIATAWLLGWKIRWMPNRHTAQLWGPNGKQILVPDTNVKDTRARSWLHQILRTASKDQVYDLAAGNVAMDDLPPEIQRVLVIMSAHLASLAAKQGNIQREEPVNSGLTQKVAEAVQPTEPPPPPKPQPPAPQAKPEPAELTVTERSRKPYVMADGKTSPIIEVVQYTNGLIMHGCTECDYVRPKPGSVRSHYIMAHPKEGQVRGGRRPQAQEPVVTVPSHTTPSEKVRVGMDLLVHNLKDCAIHGAVSGGKYLLDRPFEERARMAILILNGHDFETMRTGAEEAIAECEREATEARRAALQAISERDSVMDELQSLKDLISGIGVKK